MERPPRNAESDRLVTDRLMCFAYLQIGVFQALAGFYSFFVVLNDYGFAASTIPGNAMAFFPYPGATKDGTRYILGKSEASSTQGTDEISPCPCGGGQPFALAAKPLHKSAKPADMAAESAWSVIKNGGFTATSIASIDGACVDAELGIEWDENWPYGYGCPYGSVKPTRKCKFSVDTDKLPGTKTPPPCYKASEALGHAQTAAFVSIVIVQWADLLICKTRSLSIYHQGMKNPVLLFGMFSETCLCLLLAYAPGVDQGLGTRPLMFIHWCPSMPYSVCIFLYDALRKFLLRRDRRTHPGKIGLVERFSYY
jgi:sodium/potassium-transporting ATPase subunit alpha